MKRHSHTFSSRAVAAVAISAASVFSCATPAGASVELPSALTGSTVPGSPFNDPSCTPSADFPNPILLLHGTTDNGTSMLPIATHLAKLGGCVWIPTYGQADSAIMGSSTGSTGGFAMGDINVASKEIIAVADYIQSTTGASKLDVMGFSQGGLQMRKLIDADPSRIDHAVGLSATFKGTDGMGFVNFFQPLLRLLSKFFSWIMGPGVFQQLVGSPVLAELATHPETHAGVVYTTISSPADTVATPQSTNQLTAVDGASVVNVDYAQTCGVARPAAHQNMPKDTTVIKLVTWGLRRDAADTTSASQHC